jgi:hypothetical protein
MAVTLSVVVVVVLARRTEAWRDRRNLGGGRGKGSFDEKGASDHAARHCELGAQGPVILTLVGHVGVLGGVNAEVVWNFPRAKARVELYCGCWLQGEYY